ncbi:CPBP family intramembrane glutamic endopeptidase [Candidatus Villigracilis saccharophilus]|uniref:CPBP family intramembrane glutamic endopeptidase n=1 Tax=Candidatus Villigracilis saccharophilus TaxID=3140684 RepID=UPI0031356130|nr:CPBP family intramembrane metalloprotease [Anaerolineales bacterium]
MENNLVDWKRVGIFIAFAFGTAWLVALVLYLTGGLTPTPYTLIMLGGGYMSAPALAHILTRLVTREGWQGLYLRPNIKKGWVYWLICWVSPALFAFAGMAVFFALFPQYYDPTFSAVTKLMEQSAAAAAGQTLPAMNPWIIVLSQTLTALLVAPILNAIPILGEEFGWRAYLQPKLMPLGGKKAMLVMGVVWGLWHAPIIAMGHNYGTEYLGAPWLGILTMTWFTFILGTFIGWAALRADSVWPAVIGHGAINGIAGIYVFFTQGSPNLVLGPSLAGIIGSWAIAVVALIIFLKRDALKPYEGV